jgi:hypothetical protein
VSDHSLLTMFVGERAPDIEVHAMPKGKVDLTVGDDWVGLSADEAIRLSHALVMAALRVNPDAVHAEMNKMAQELFGGMIA